MAVTSVRKNNKCERGYRSNKKRKSTTNPNQPKSSNPRKKRTHSGGKKKDNNKIKCFKCDKMGYLHGEKQRGTLS